MYSRTDGGIMVTRFGNDEFSELADYISGNYGIDLSKKKILAECRLNTLIQKTGAGSLKEFLSMMKNDATGRMEVELLDKLTTNYTYFLREDKHFNFLEQEILPGIPAGLKNPGYRIWCAGCSTGEECYTLSMYIKQFMKEHLVLFDFHILGTDISESALKKAEAGQYPLWELGKIPEEWQRAYCNIDQEHGTFTIKKEILDTVSFRRGNLLQPFGGQMQYDLILCRNVMIYFNEESRKKMLDNLYMNLKTGGYLFLGHTELLSRNHERFQCVRPAIYRK